MYIPSSPAGMVDVRHSEKLGVLQRAQYEHKLLLLLWNIHVYVCGEAGHIMYMYMYMHTCSMHVYNGCPWPLCYQSWRLSLVPYSVHTLAELICTALLYMYMYSALTLSFKKWPWTH